MSAKTRYDLILKLHKFCKKEYSVVTPPSSRTVIEHMLYGCCLENSTVDTADDAFAKLQENFFDWNEVRVTTASELAELMKGLSYPKQSALSIKKTLHGIFECYYQFDLEFLRKENLSKALTQFERFKGVSPFVVSYVAQHGLGGHSIPLDRSMMLLFYTLGIASEDEATSGRVTGLERTIPKAKGIEFSSVVHQLAVAFASSPFSPKVREQLLKINKDAKELFPKRGAKKKLETTVADEVTEIETVDSKPAAAKTAAKSKNVTKKPVVKKKVSKQPAVKRKTKTSPAAEKKNRPRTKTPIRKK